MTFRVGQKVVCVDGSDHASYECEGTIMPIEKQIYTIRETIIGPRCGTQHVRLVEILNTSRLTVEDGYGEPWFRCSRFRAIVERKTDISVFTSMLNTNKVNERA